MLYSALKKKPLISTVCIAAASETFFPHSDVQPMKCNNRNKIFFFLVVVKFNFKVETWEEKKNHTFLDNQVTIDNLSGCGGLSLSYRRQHHKSNKLIMTKTSLDVVANVWWLFILSFVSFSRKWHFSWGHWQFDHDSTKQENVLCVNYRASSCHNWCDTVPVYSMSGKVKLSIWA